MRRWAVLCAVFVLVHVLASTAASIVHGAASKPLSPTAPCAASLPWRAIDAPASIAAARAVIARHYPQRVASFNLSITAKARPSDPDFFTLATDRAASRVDLVGTSAVMLTAGFHYYLSYYLNVTLLTWSSSVPPALPHLVALPAAVRVSSPYLYRYYYNICTLSYSTAFWSWAQWEREIDWMALRGVNFPLALNGQERVWYDVYSDLGLNHTEIVDFIAGPAFLAWQRMGNIQVTHRHYRYHHHHQHALWLMSLSCAVLCCAGLCGVQGWGGPMTMTWMRQQVELQRLILARMRSLDMYPILAAFDGYVPRAVKFHYPNASIAASAGWSSFPRPYQNDDLLDPKDPLFQRIGSLFIARQTATFGTDHFYNSDTYNENSPSTNATAYLADVSAAVYRAMTASDSAAVWVMQGWVFVSDPNFWQPAQVQAYLGSVPNDRMIILDLMSEISPVFSRTKDYFGKPFVWNMLHNFGGNNGMMAMLPVVSTAPALAKQSVGDALVGIGTTPEGIFQNEIAYDLLFDMAWRGRPIADLHGWVRRWATRRYSLPAASLTAFAPVLRAWDLLVGSVYNCTSGQWGVTKSFLELTPSLQMNASGFMATTLWYDNAVLERAFGLALSGSAVMEAVELTGRERYQYDLIDFGKQWMSNLLIGHHAHLVAAYHARNATALQAVGAVILDLISDWDSLLATNVHFLLGPWIEDARRWGTTIAEQDALEFNARNQITLWGPTGQIADYASKQWSGLISAYYAPRWRSFIAALTDAAQRGVEWNEAAFSTAKRAAEEAWQVSKEKYPTTPVGRTVQWAAHVYTKYSRPAASLTSVE